MSYSKGEFIDFLIKVFGEGKSSNGGNNYSVFCPRCEENNPDLEKIKLVVKTTVPHLLHCWVCSIKAKSLLPILKSYYPEHINEYKERFFKKEELVVDSSYDEEFEKSFNKEIELPEEFILLSSVIEGNDVFINRNKRFFDYLDKRNISFEDYWYYKLGISFKDKKYFNRIIIPSFDASGKLNYFTTRAISDFNKPKNLHCDIKKSTIIFNEINIDWTKELTIVEGVFDLMKCNDNATCLLGSELHKKHRLFEKITENKTPILLALDKDAQQKQIRIAKLLNEYGISVRILIIPNNVNDVGEMKKGEYITHSQNAKLFQERDWILYKINSI